MASALTFGAGGSDVVYRIGLNITANGGGAAVVAENNSVTLSAARYQQHLAAERMERTIRLSPGTGTTTMASEGARSTTRRRRRRGHDQRRNRAARPANTFAFGSGVTGEHYCCAIRRRSDIDVMGSSSQVTNPNWSRAPRSQLKDITAATTPSPTPQFSPLMRLRRVARPTIPARPVPHRPGAQRSSSAGRHCCGLEGFSETLTPLAPRGAPANATTSADATSTASQGVEA